jgi:hypothetical protein
MVTTAASGIAQKGLWPLLTDLLHEIDDAVFQDGKHDE